MSVLSLIQDFAQNLKAHFSSFHLAYEYKAHSNIHFLQLPTELLEDEQFLALEWAFTDQFEDLTGAGIAFIDQYALTQIEQPEWEMSWGTLPEWGYEQREIQADWEALESIWFQGSDETPPNQENFSSQIKTEWSKVWLRDASGVKRMLTFEISELSQSENTYSIAA
ncbi:MAG: hypothetical protein AAF399_07865 [Bacteroidota bacterium]